MVYYVIIQRFLKPARNRLKAVTNQSKEVHNHCDIFPTAVLSISAPDKGLCRFVTVMAI